MTKFNSKNISVLFCFGIFQRLLIRGETNNCGLLVEGQIEMDRSKCKRLESTARDIFRPERKKNAWYIRPCDSSCV